MTITSSPSSPSLSCAIADIVAQTTDSTVAVTVALKPLGSDGEAETVYSESLLPVGGQLTLTDLSTLIAPYAYDAGAVAVEATLKDSTATKAVAFTVVYSAADVDIPADDFLSAYFLTIFQGTRRTSPSRLEYLHYYQPPTSDDAPTPQATATYADATTLTIDLTPTVNGSIATIDVSPSRLLNASGLPPTAYTVTAGQRTQAYEVGPDIDCAPIVLFRNSFGCHELFYCLGTHTVSPTFSRSSSRIHGLLRNYKIEETRAFKADTGPLTTAEAAWLDELFRAEEVYVCNALPSSTSSDAMAVTPTKEIVITDSESKWTNDDDSRPSFQFTYQYAQRTQNVLQLRRAGRIFDNTFDYTFA